MKRVLAFILCITLTACGSVMTLGGTETGNPEDELRAITGSVGTSATTNITAKSAGPRSSKALEDCAADTIIAINSADTEAEHSVEADCSFSFDVSVPGSYELVFERDGEFIAAMEFDNDNSGFRDATFVLHDATTALNLGDITINGTLALAEFRVAEQNDQDGDGINDFEESDDDDDGEDDEDEHDCDFDGYFDFFDVDDDECGEDSDEEASVVRVFPRHDAQRTKEHRLVDVDRSVRARFDCEIDEDSIDDESFVIESEFGDEISCEFEVGADLQHVRCEHDQDEFDTDTVYTATIDGMECLDGRAVEERSWSWKTRDE